VKPFRGGRPFLRLLLFLKAIAQEQRRVLDYPFDVFTQGMQDLFIAFLNKPLATDRAGEGDDRLWKEGMIYPLFSNLGHCLLNRIGHFEKKVCPSLPPLQGLVEGRERKWSTRCRMLS